MDLHEFQIPEDALEQLRDPEVLRKHVEEGKSFQEILHINDEEMHRYYSTASHFFYSQQYQKASDAFTFLTTLNPNVYEYWLGLGMAEHRLEEYNGALLAYGMAVIACPPSPLPHFYKAHCYSSLGESASALASLKVSLRFMGSRTEYDELRKKALILQEKLEK